MSTNVALDASEEIPLGREVGARLAAERKRLGLNQEQLAERCGVSKTSQVNYETGKRSPDIPYLTLAMQLGVDVMYVIAGGGQRDPSDSTYVSVPLLNIRASAGGGAINEDETHHEEQGLAFQKAWLDQRRLSHQALRVIEVKGRSMEPVLTDGDRVLIDLSDTRPRSGYVYVLRQGEELLIKYCQLMPGGVIRVSSANAQFATYDVFLNESPDVVIVGRVVASMHEW